MGIKEKDDVKELPPRKEINSDTSKEYIFTHSNKLNEPQINKTIGFECEFYNEEIDMCEGSSGDTLGICNPLKCQYYLNKRGLFREESP